MINDYEQELTVSGGHGIDFTGAEYGSKPYDLMSSSPGDPAIGEPLGVFMQILTADAAALTSMDIAIIDHATEASPSVSPVVLLTRNYLLARLTTALGVRKVGTIPPGVVTQRFLSVRFTVNGSAGTGTCTCKVWLGKATDLEAHNAGVNIGPL